MFFDGATWLYTMLVVILWEYNKLQIHTTELVTAITAKTCTGNSNFYSLPISILPSPAFGVKNPTPNAKDFIFFHSFSETDENPDTQLAIKLQNILKNYRDSPTPKLEQALSHSAPPLTEDLVLNVLKRHRSDWKSAYTFFNWVHKEGGINLGFPVYNEILDTLGKMRRFEEVTQLLDEMSKRAGLVKEETYGVLVNRYVADHRVDEAIWIFKERKELGLELHLAAFQKLLMCLCRYKHVDAAETLLHSMEKEFGLDADIKTMNIVLNGWCVMRNLYEAKRFWKYITESKLKLDLFTYGTYIKVLANQGRYRSALKLYQGMWEEEEGCKPDVVICSCVIDVLCSEKKVTEALEVFREMRERGCLPNVVTYNSLIKHLCKMGKMEKVYELLDEMEESKGDCMPNNITFSHLLKSLNTLQEIDGVLERMRRNSCAINAGTYNLILKLYLGCGDDEKVRYTWDEMEKNGLGPDRRSYTIMIHGLYDRGRIEDAMKYFGEMTSKGLVPESRTEVLVSFMKKKLKEKAAE